jgi:hypothetical protein
MSSCFFLSLVPYGSYCFPASPGGCPRPFPRRNDPRFPEARGGREVVDLYTPKGGAKVERSGGYRKRKLTTRTPDRAAFCRFFSTRGDFRGVLKTQRSQVQILPPQPIRSRVTSRGVTPFPIWWSDWLSKQLNDEPSDLRRTRLATHSVARPTTSLRKHRAGKVLACGTSPGSM